MSPTQLTSFAQRYAEAWCNQVPERVADFYVDNGSLVVNDGAPAVGRAAITEVARGFMNTFPDMKVTMNRVTTTPDGGVFHWTLAGTNAGPGGTGNTVRINGCEVWQLGSDGLIRESKGHFDNADYERQLRRGTAFDPN